MCRPEVDLGFVSQGSFPPELFALFHMDKCFVCMYVCAPDVCLEPTEVRREAFETGVMEGWEPLSRC